MMKIRMNVLFNAFLFAITIEKYSRRLEGAPNDRRTTVIANP